MRRLWFLLILFSLACRALSPLAMPAEAPVATAIPSREASPTAEITGDSAEPGAESFGYSVRAHPDGGLYVGDRVSFEVIAPPSAEAREVSVRLKLGYGETQELGSARFSPFGILGRLQATLTWVWDTRFLEPGEYTVFFTLHPQNLTWEERFTLLPASQLVSWEARSAWASARSECCTVFYLTGTEAERDLPALLETIDLQAEQASRNMGVQITEPITITLLPRLLGHGGFADQDIHVSYLDRNYTIGDLGMILHHEIIHVLDARQGGDLRPSLLVEGLAVYLTGGHYQPEPLLPRAAALLSFPGWFIPLEELAMNFYTSQHEIGYLEGGALVAFMVQRWGLPAFMDFYRDIHPHPSGSIARALDQALKSHFGMSLAALEAEFLQELKRQIVPSDVAENLRLTIALYDTARYYQQLLDPSAYFLTPWLVDTREMRRLEITADYLRRPEEPANLAIETMLAQASAALKDNRFVEAERLLKAVETVLQAMEQGVPHPFSQDALAADYFDIVTVLKSSRVLTSPLSSNPLQPQIIKVEGDQAVVYYRTAEPTLATARLVRGRNGWRWSWSWEQGN